MLLFIQVKIFFFQFKSVVSNSQAGIIYLIAFFLNLAEKVHH